MITLTWKTSVTASAIHAAQVLTAPITKNPSASAFSFREQSNLIALLPSHDPVSRDEFLEIATGLSKRFETGIVGSNRSEPEFLIETTWKQLLEEICYEVENAGNSAPVVGAASIDSPQVLTGVSQKSAGIVSTFSIDNFPEKLVDVFAVPLRELETNYRQMYPKIDDQLILRSRPIQESWVGFGRGLMAHIKRMTQSDWLAPSATAVLVQPVCGGEGMAFPRSSCFFMEAMLTNASPELPEVLRVAWLASQMGCEKLTDPQDRSPIQNSKTIAIAMMMCTLASGEVLELCRCDEPTVIRALQLWGNGSRGWQAQPPIDINATAKVLIAWWETHLQTRPELSISMLALEKMLAR